MDYLHRSTQPRPGRRPAWCGSRSLPAGAGAARSEWFIAGTESPVIALVRDDHRTPKILYPGEASILALDPDIPDATQRVFSSRRAAKACAGSWTAPLAQATTDYAWRPTPGPHQALIDADARPIASTRFQVEA
jgi:penicillin-binding protein 1C